MWDQDIDHLDRYICSEILLKFLSPLNQNMSGWQVGWELCLPTSLTHSGQVSRTKPCRTWERRRPPTYFPLISPYPIGKVCGVFSRILPDFHQVVFNITFCRAEVLVLIFFFPSQYKFLLIFGFISLSLSLFGLLCLFWEHMSLRI